MYFYNPILSMILHMTNLPSITSTSTEIPVEEASTHDVTVEGDPVTTYHIEELTSIRGCKKLYDSTGFSYVVRRKNSETTLWRCRVPSKHTKCNAQIGQLGDKFEHSHQPAVSAKVVAEISYNVLQLVTYSELPVLLSKQNTTDPFLNVPVRRLAHSPPLFDCLYLLYMGGEQSMATSSKGHISPDFAH